MRTSKASLLGTAILVTSSLTAPLKAASVPSTNNSINHVMIVIFENTDYKKVMKQPFFVRLAKEGTNFVKMYAETHPSQANYFAMVAGSKLGVKNDSTVTVDARHIGDLLEEHGKNWKVYAERSERHWDNERQDKFSRNLLR